MRCLLTAALFVVGTLTSQAQPSLPAAFHAKVIHALCGEQQFVGAAGV